jgi:hypothetical protein
MVHNVVTMCAIKAHVHYDVDVAILMTKVRVKV